MLATALAMGGLGALVDAGVASAGPANATYALFPTEASFPSVPLGQSNSIPVTITATSLLGGTEVANNPAVTFSGPDKAQFKIASSGGCDGYTFMFPGDNCTEYIVYTPTTVGFATATATFADNDGDTIQIPLEGEGLGDQLVANPNPVNFGTNVPAGSPVQLPVSITNIGPADADLPHGSITIGGTDPGNFLVTGSGNTCDNVVLSGSADVPAPAPAAQTCSLTVEFIDGTSGDTDNALLEISPSNGEAEFDVPLFGSTTLPAPGPTVMTPPTAGFGNVALGGVSGIVALTLTNESTTTASHYAAFSNADITGPDASNFTIVPGGTCAAGGGTLGPVGSVAPPNSCTIDFQFSPTAGGNDQATFTESFTDGQASVSSLLTGNGLNPAYEITGGPINFGDVNGGQISSPSNVVLYNTGNTPLTITSGPTITGPFVAGPASGCVLSGPSVLVPGASCTIAVAFDPAANAGGTQSGSISIPLASGSIVLTPATVALTGTATENYFTVTPDFTFPTTADGTSSGAQIFTVTNVSGIPLTFAAAVIGGPDATSFPIVTDGCNGKTLSPSESCQITVDFTPATNALGPLAAELVVSTSAPTLPPVLVPLNGTAVAGTTVSVSPNPVQFGPVTIGTVSVEQAVQVDNTGTTPLVITSLSILGSENGDFNMVTPTSGCQAGTPVAGGSSCTIDVVFNPKPGFTGPVSATLEIADNAAGHPQQVLLEGTADALVVGQPAVVASPPFKDFGPIGLNITSSAQTFVISNATGVPVTIGAASQAGPDASQFGSGSLPNSNNCTGVTLDAGDTCTVTETVTPTQLGALSAELNILFGPAPPAPAPGPGSSVLTIPLFASGVSDTTVSISPNPDNFGNQQVGTTSGLSAITVTNTGTNPLIGSAVVPVPVGPGATDYTIVSDTCTATPIAPGGTCVIDVDFHPGAVGTLDASFTLANNATGSPETVQLTGTGVAQPAGGTVTASPSALHFGDVGINLTSSPQSVTVTNNTTASVTITGVADNGSDFHDFGNGTGGPTVDGCTGVSLNPGNSCTFTETFTPSIIGLESANAEISYAGGNLIVPMDGIGISDTTDSLSGTLNFPTTQAGTSSAIMTETITNNGPGALVVTAVNPGAGADQADFVDVGNTCVGAPIPSGLTCQVFVDFSPTTAKGSEAGTFTLADNAGGPQTFATTGTSVSQPAGPGVVTATPNPVLFGSEGVGVRTAAMTVTVDNGTASSITFPTAATIVGADAGDFGIAGAPDSDGCTAAGINAGNTCTLTVSFDPSMLTVESASLLIPYSGGTLNVLLTGTGVQASEAILTPGPLNFPNTPVNTDSASMAEVITNVGSVPLTITAIGVQGTDASQFPIQDPTACLTVLAPGATCEVDVVFAPTGPVGSGNRSASLVFTDTAAGSPQVAQLTGTTSTNGVNGGLSISPVPSLTFPTTGVGSNSLAETVTVTNNSTTNPIALNNISVTGPQATEFVTVADGCSGQTLGFAGSGNNTCTIQLSFKPTVVGLATAVISVTPVTGPAVSTILDGQGVPVTTDLIQPTELDFGNIVQGAQSADQIFTITNTGLFNPLIVTSITPTGTDAADFTVISDTCITGAVDPGLSCSVAVVFSPTVPAPGGASPSEVETATLNIADNANGSQQLVNLTGQSEAHAVAYTLTTLPASSLTNPFLNFGPQAVGTVSPPQTVTVTNTATGCTPSNPQNCTQALVFPTTGDVALASVLAGGTSQFRIINDLCKGDEIDPPGANTTDTCTVDVEFAPTVPNGPVFDYLDFFPTNGSSQAYQVELIGNGVQPGSAEVSCDGVSPCGPGLAANGINFGNQVINTTSPTHSVVITNTSATANLLITGISIVGTNASDFAILPIPGDCGTSFPVVVQIGVSCALTVDFTPSALGPRTGTINIVDNTPNSPNQVALTGVGIPYTPIQGYWLDGSDGGVFAFGAAHYYGSMGNILLNKPIVGMSSTADGKGYWLVASDGGVFTFGDAQYYGSTALWHLNAQIIGITTTPDGGGYWLLASDGGIFSFGDAQFYGSTGSLKLNKPVVAMAKTPSGHGYYLVASDGGIFSFGDAVFHGSAANYNLNQPINGMVVSPDDGGYLLSAYDGGVFAFGDAVYKGSAVSLNLKKQIVGIASTPDFGGYWQVGDDGGVFAYGDAQFHGSIGDTVLVKPDIVGIAVDPVTGF